MTEKWLSAIDNKNFVGSLFDDFSKAFHLLIILYYYVNFIYTNAQTTQYPGSLPIQVEDFIAFQ